MTVEKLFKVLLVLTLSTVSTYSAVSDATWKAVIGRQIIIVLVDSQEIRGTLLSYADSVVTIVKTDGSVTSIDAEKATLVKMELEQTSKKEGKVIDKSFKKEKTFGPVIGFGPGIIGVNADIKNVNLFASASFIFPILTEAKIWAFSVGGGRLVRIGDSGWKFNLFSNASLFTDQREVFEFDQQSSMVRLRTRTEYNYAVGIGVGFQYTTANGILISFKLPAVGFSFNSWKIRGEGVVLYYPHSGASFPAIVFGKSF